MHNALHQVHLRCGALSLSGFSISGLATYLQVPELDVCFDMGECPLSAVPLRHVLLTHAHGDHARCLLRHSALRRMLGLAGDATYFMPAAIAEDFNAVARADARFEGVDADDFVAPTVIALRDGDVVPLPHRKNTLVRAFAVDHRGVPSLGYTVLERRKKVLAPYALLPGVEIAALRRQGVEVTADVDAPLVTFIGDCVGSSLDNAAVWQAPVVVIEATYVDPADREMAARKGHTHIDEIGALLATLDPATLPEHIVLKHFSMKVSRDDVDAAISRAIPEAVRPRVQVLLHDR